jgi:exosortase
MGQSMATAQVLPLDNPQTRPAGANMKWLALVLSGLVLTIAHGPLFFLHLSQIWLRDHYQFFPLVFAGAAVLAWSRLRNLGPLSAGSSSVTFGLLAAAWIILAASELLYSSWLGAVATLTVIPAILYGMGGGRLFRAAFPAWLLLWLVIPPPFEWDRELILSLQALTTHWASHALDLLGVYHVMAGNVVEVEGKRMLVEESCAGISSLFSVLAVTTFFVLWSRRPLWRAVGLIGAAIGWVLLANVARVAGVVYLTTHWGVDVTEGWRHDAFGAVVFSLALVSI